MHENVKTPKDKKKKEKTGKSIHISSNVFRTHSLTFLLNAVLSSRHIIDASILAAESQFGSLNIERTDRRIVSKNEKNINKVIEKKKKLKFTNGLYR